MQAASEIAFDQERGNCPVCHVLPAPDAVLLGDMGPSLVGVADQLSQGQVRLRLVGGRRLNPTTVMPPYCRPSGPKRVAAVYATKPVLAAQEIEELVPCVMSLRREKR